MFKKMKLSAVLIGIFCLFLVLSKVSADGDDITIGSKSYISYVADVSEGAEGKNQFKVHRSYLTLKKKIYKHLSFRITLDAHQDDDGDMEARLKYVYAHFKFDDFLFLTKPNIEFGIVHMPWLDFESSINQYRMTGKMFMERNKLFNSADIGITVAGLLGGEMDDDYKKNINKKYPGRYGSYAFGVYNGGGYHEIEKNTMKNFEARISLRPLPDYVPGLQISYFGIMGMGNQHRTDSTTIPEWKSSAGMLSYNHNYFTVSGTYVMGEGNQKGNLEDAFEYHMGDYTGYQAFAEIKPFGAWKLFGRYEQFDPDNDFENDKNTRMIFGVGYDFGHHNILILDYDKVTFEDSKETGIDMLKLTMQVSF